MQKAFDVQDLIARLKAVAVPEAEKVAKDIVDKCVFPWLKDSLALEAVSQPVYAIGVPLLDAIQKPLDEALAKLLPDAAV